MDVRGDHDECVFALSYCTCTCTLGKIRSRSTPKLPRFCTPSFISSLNFLTENPVVMMRFLILTEALADDKPQGPLHNGQPSKSSCVPLSLID